MISITMSECEYEAALVTLQSTHGVGVIFLVGSTTSGHFTSPDYSADFNYNGAELELINGQKHGMAHFADDETIKEHMISLLGELKCQDEATEPQTEQVTPTPKPFVKPVVSANALPVSQTDSNLDSSTQDVSLEETTSEHTS